MRKLKLSLLSVGVSTWLVILAGVRLRGVAFAENGTNLVSQTNTDQEADTDETDEAATATNGMPKQLLDILHPQSNTPPPAPAQAPSPQPSVPPPAVASPTPPPPQSPAVNRAPATISGTKSATTAVERSGPTGPVGSTQHRFRISRSADYRDPGLVLATDGPLDHFRAQPQRADQFPQSVQTHTGRGD